MQQPDFNSPSVVLSGILLGTIGVLSFIVQPGLVQGFVTELGLSEADANQLAFDEMLGVAIATYISSFFNRHINWRILLAVGLLLATVGNIGSAVWLAAPQDLSIARFIAGLGEGVVISLSFTIIGLTSRTERNLAAYLVLLLSYGALGLWLMPSAFDAIGLSGIFYCWAVISLLSFYTIRYIPTSSNSSADDLSNQQENTSLSTRAIALVGVLLFNLAIGVTWANLFLIGMEITADEQRVADALLICQFVAIIGALIPVFMERQLGIIKPIIITIVFSALAIAALLNQSNYHIYIIAACVFNALWNFGLPFILSGVGSMDSRGNMISTAIALQMTGLGFGPFLAALVLDNSGSFNDIKLLIIGLFAASAVPLIYALTRHKGNLQAQVQT